VICLGELILDFISAYLLTEPAEKAMSLLKVDFF